MLVHGMKGYVLTLPRSVNYFYKTHTIVHYQLLPVSVFYRWVICLANEVVVVEYVRSVAMRHTSIGKRELRDTRRQVRNAPTKQFNVNLRLEIRYRLEHEL